MAKAKEKPRIIGDVELPIRASNLPKLFQCPKMFVDAVMNGDNRRAGEAAETGSLIHLGIEAFHKMGESEAAAFSAIKSGREIYTYADYETAEKEIAMYIKWVKQNPRGEVIFTETKIKISVQPVSWDVTGLPITITGTLDQIRKIGNGHDCWYYLIDHKTGQKPGDAMVKEYLPQLSAYLLGAVQAIKSERVKVFITRTKDLRSSRNPFYWPLQLDVARAHNIMKQVAQRIAIIRNHIIETSYGKHCDYCQHTYDYPQCVDDTGVKRPTDSNRIPLKTMDVKKPMLTAEQLFNAGTPLPKPATEKPAMTAQQLFAGIPTPTK